jgi:transposase
LRRYLYLAALSASRCDAELRAFHQRRLGRGKAPKSATCAVAHTLLTRLMARVRDMRTPQAEFLPMAA